MQIQLNQILPYIPFNVDCQYQGIINGKELKEQDKQFSDDGHPFTFDIQPIMGLKIAPIKELRIFKNYWKVYIGHYRIGLKSFINGHDFKPLLLPLSELYNHPADEEINNVCNGFIGIKYFHVNDCPYNSFQVLAKYHFDVFKLIDAGLALNKLDYIKS